MWQTISQAIVDATQTDFEIKHKQQITGGDINLCFWISNYHQNFFVKINDLDRYPIFDAEAFSLKHIKQTNIINCPNVITLGKTLDKSFLVLEHIAFSDPCNKDWRLFGEQLAFMHQQTSNGMFGWDQDNYIGRTLQPNQWQSNWRTFFAEQRIGWQLQLLAEKSIVLGDVDHIVEVCHDALLHHKVNPCLVHGDLWQGNVGFNSNTPVIFDPACYYGDREVDIAMTELFTQLPVQFYQGYSDIYPLPASYDDRKLIYNFYHLLNHANLFAGSYIVQAKAQLSKILALH